MATDTHQHVPSKPGVHRVSLDGQRFLQLSDMRLLALLCLVWLVQREYLRVQRLASASTSTRAPCLLLSGHLSVQMIDLQVSE